MTDAFTRLLTATRAHFVTRSDGPARRHVGSPRPGGAGSRQSRSGEESPATTAGRLQPAGPDLLPATRSVSTTSGCRRTLPDCSSAPGRQPRRPSCRRCGRSSCAPTVREQATRGGRPGPTRFDAYVWEALRLDPINPLLFRFTERDSIVAAGTARETTGSRKGPSSSRSPPRRCPTRRSSTDPDEFPRPTGPGFLGLHFGYGHHACLGRYVGARSYPR